MSNLFFKRSLAMNKHIYKSIFFIGLIFSLSMNGQEPFICDGDFYLSVSLNNAPSSFFRIQIEELTGDVTFDALQNGTNASLNGAGYRITDNLIYAIQPESYVFYQIDATGSNFQIANLALPPGFGYYGAAITPDGDFMVFIGSGSSGTGFSSFNLCFVDLNDPAYPIDKVLNITGGNVICTDIAFDPFTGTLYGFDSWGNRLVTFDTQTGAVITNQFPSTNVADGIGALFFDSFGNLYGYGNNFNTNLATELYRIDKNTGALTLASTGPVATGKDGCSCPYTIKLQKSVFPELSFPCTEVIYTFQISNASGEPKTGIDFFDQMPDGLTILEILNNPFGGIVEIIGSNQLSITDMTIPLGIHNFQARVYVEENVVGILKNQAVLSNLPVALGEFTLSDNPKTIQIEDSTTLEIVPLFVDLGSDSIQICEGAAVLLEAGEHNGLTYQWSNGATSSSIEVAQPGNYAVTVESGCETVFDATLVTDLAAGVSLPADITIDLGESFTIVPNIQGFGNITYQWIDPLGNSLSCQTCLQPEAQPFFDVAYALEIETEEGCTAIDTMLIFVNKNRDIYIPNAFSPNNDGINDLFYLYSKNPVRIVTLQIFDRWGDMVFESEEGFTNDPILGWNGKFNDEKMNAAVFVWWAELEYLDGVRERRTGDLVLVR